MDWSYLIKLISKLPINVLQNIASFCFVVMTKLSNNKTLQYMRLNIAIAFPQLSEEEQHKLYLKAAKNEFRSYLEFIHIWGANAKTNIALIHSVTGEQYLHEALTRKKGVVLIIPHFGTWEIMNNWLGQFTDLTVMYKPIKNPTMNSFVLKARSHGHAHLVPTDETGVKLIFKALKQGGTTIILPDHSPDHGGELINWFGVPLHSSQLIAKMVQKTQASALLLYAKRNEQHGFDMYIEPMPDALSDASQNGTALIHHTVEQLIYRFPEHYHWSYKRFKASPATKRIYTLEYDQALSLIRSIQAESSTPRQ